MLNKNPVFLARHFQYRVEAFFVEMLCKGKVLGDMSYYAIRLEFQFRGSPHIHSFIWVLNPPVLSMTTLETYKIFVDSTVQAYLPDENEDKKLHDLVKKYQTHRHSKSCRKYKNKECRYYYGRFFTKETIIALPLSNDLSVEHRSVTMASRHDILSKVKCYIDEYLDPSKANYV